jgi:hypothetical protein
MPIDGGVLQLTRLGTNNRFLGFISSFPKRKLLSALGAHSSDQYFHLSCEARLERAASMAAVASGIHI